MKKTILVIAAVACIALTGTQAFACYWDGYWGGPNGGPMAGYYGDTYAPGNYQGFYDDTSQLRQNLAAKQREYNALMATPNIDSKRAAQLRSEISALHDQLSAQARSYNLPAPNAGYYGRMGGYGWGW
jgi:zinc resistance-associated protein